MNIHDILERYNFLNKYLIKDLSKIVIEYLLQERIRHITQCRSLTTKKIRCKNPRYEYYRVHDFENKQIIRVYMSDNCRRHQPSIEEKNE